MNLAFFLKILTDLCYYGTFAAFFASIYGLTGSVLPQFALLALAGDIGCGGGPSVVGLVSDGFGGELKAGLLAAILFPIFLIWGIRQLRKMEG